MPQPCVVRAFKPAVCPPSNLSNPSFKPFRRPFQGNSRSYTPQPSVFKGVQDCRLPAFKPLNPSNPPAGLSKATLAATRPSHLVFQGVEALFARRQTLQTLKPFRRPFQGNSRSYTPQPSAFKGVQDCRLPALNPSNPSNPPAGLSKATLAATRPSHLFFRVFKPAVCPPLNLSYPSNPSAGLFKATLAATRPSHLFLRAFKRAVCPPSNPSNRSAGLSKATLAATRPIHGLQEPVIHLFSWAFCSGTCHFVFLHGFPAGVSCLTWTSPNERDDHTTVWHTRHEWAWRRVSLLTRPSFT